MATLKDRKTDDELALPQQLLAGDTKRKCRGAYCVNIRIFIFTKSCYKQGSQMMFINDAILFKEGGGRGRQAKR